MKSEEILSIGKNYPLTEHYKNINNLSAHSQMVSSIADTKTSKCFLVLLSFDIYLLLCIQLNGFNFCNLTLIIQFDIFHVEECTNSDPCDLNTVLQPTHTSDEMDLATGVHATINVGYKNGSAEVWRGKRTYDQSLSVAKLGCTSVGRVGGYTSGQVYPGSGGSRSRLSDVESGKLAFMSGVSRPASEGHTRWL